MLPGCSGVTPCRNNSSGRTSTSFTTSCTGGQFRHMLTSDDCCLATAAAVSALQTCKPRCLTFDALPSQGRPGGSCLGVGVSHTRHSGQCRAVPCRVPLVAGASAHRACRRVPTLLWEFAIQQVGCWWPQAGCEWRQREQWRQQRWRRQQKELSKRGDG